MCRTKITVFAVLESTADVCTTAWQITLSMLLKYSPLYIAKEVQQYHHMLHHRLYEVGWSTQ